MALLIGLALGTGLLLIWFSCWDAPVRPASTSSRHSLGRKLDTLVKQSGVQHISARGVVLGSLFCGGAVFLLMTVITRAIPLGLCFGLFATAAPVLILRWNAAKRHTQLREVWPDAVDHIRSAVRAGLTLPEALSQLGANGPEELRPGFQAFTSDYRSGMRFSDALARLKDRLADPIADRLVATLTIARDVGGADLGVVLETFSEFLRQDARTRSELEARQSWTVNGARLAVVAPWVVLLLLATQPDAIAAYRTFAGGMVLALGMVVSVICYRLMRRIGALPAERRIL